MESSKIEWCDHTFNPWEGCTKVGPGCDHCYAEARNHRFGGGNWGFGAPRRRTSEATWRKPEKWERAAELGLFLECERCGLREARTWDDSLPPGGLSCCSNPECTALPESESFRARPRVFCASLADWLDNEVDIDWLADLLALICQTPYLDWLMLSKRIGQWRARVSKAREALAKRKTGDYMTALLASETVEWLDLWLEGKPPINVWMGATVVNQKEADRDIPKLQEVPARIRFLSMEPLMGHVDLRDFLSRGDNGLADMDPLAAAMLRNAEHEGTAWIRPKIDWVIVGGESGPNARPMHPEWPRSLRDQCEAAGAPFLFKQWGEWRHWSDQDQTDYLYSRDRRKMRFHGLAIHVDGTSSSNASELPNHDEDSITQVYRVGKKVAGRELDGRTWDQIPEAPCS